MMKARRREADNREPPHSTREQGSAPPLNNEQIADRLEEIAELLETQHANPFRINAYRNAAATLRRLTKPVGKIIEEEGTEGLVELPSIGKSLARAIEHLATSGRLGLLERLRGETNPEKVLMTVPGIGTGLASEIHETLGIETLEDLETAAHDGRLLRLKGMGQKRIRAVQECLATRLGRRRLSSSRALDTAGEPGVAELLDVDDEYVRKVKSGELPVIAPRRFNPSGHAWLPVLHTHRGERHYTALYSNTARAHELGATHDWVVIYRDDHDGHGQWTIVTSRFGSSKGRRLVRGREKECAQHYAARPGVQPSDPDSKES